MLLPGEEEAVKQVIRIADQYGYGNLIAHLKRGWALQLMEKNPALSYLDALKATDVEAYPQELTQFDERPEWKAARQHLWEVIGAYREASRMPNVNTSYALGFLGGLMIRFDSGERTPELLAAMEGAE